MLKINFGFMGAMAMSGLFLAACHSPADVEFEPREPEIGFLHYGGQVGTIEITEGDQVRVQIVTLGNGCTRAADTVVEISGDTATITPLDVTDTDRPCPLIVERVHHEVSFDRSAAEFVVVNARRHPSLEPVSVRYILNVSQFR